VELWAHRSREEDELVARVHERVPLEERERCAVEARRRRGLEQERLYGGRLLGFLESCSGDELVEMFEPDDFAELLGAISDALND
jgi:hypothetical protein